MIGYEALLYKTLEKKSSYALMFNAAMIILPDFFSRTMFCILDMKL